MSPTSSLHRILYGRNCLLNDLIESTFTSVTAISETKAIVGSDTGDICLLDDTTNNQAFAKIGRVNFGITSSCLDLHDRVLLTGREGRIRSIPRKSFLEGQPLGDLGSVLPDDGDCPILAPFLALAPFVDHVVAVDANRFIKLLKSPSDDTEAPPDIARRLPAHGAPVLGVRPCYGSDQDDAAFFTWAADGTVLFWTQDGTCKSTVNVELEQADGTDDGSVNELRVVRTFSKGTTLITGDKYGVLRSVSFSIIVILSLTWTGSFIATLVPAFLVLEPMQARLQISQSTKPKLFWWQPEEEIELFRSSNLTEANGILSKHLMNTLARSLVYSSPLMGAS
jgi:hypothetical protein